MSLDECFRLMSIKARLTSNNPKSLQRINTNAITELQTCLAELVDNTGRPLATNPLIRFHRNAYVSDCNRQINKLAPFTASLLRIL